MKTSVVNIDQVREFLDGIPKFSTNGQSAANFNLDRMKLFCARLGNPQKNFRSIHVAGTNGKGTVCRLLASIYQTAGYKVGLYTSPHLERVEERFKINSVEISEAQMVTFFELYGDMVLSAELTFFELTTAIAFWFFSEESIDLAIIETGLGGRLDATNVIDPVASVITSIGLDHMEILGNSLQAIAHEKGGIIKAGRPVFTGKLTDEIQTELKQIADQRGSVLYALNTEAGIYSTGSIRINCGAEDLVIRTDSLKPIDLQNIQLCMNIVNCLESQFSVSKENFRSGVEMMEKSYPNRAVFERLSDHQKWYFDGAHNGEATRQLTDHLKQIAPADSWHVILSFMSDKLNGEISGQWSEFKNISVYEMPFPRAAKLEAMLKHFKSAKVIDDRNGINLHDFKSELVIFSGSFYFYSVVRRWMGTMNAY